MANSTPVVSVILPFHNAPYLKESIESILSQTFQDFELILVNNASTDDSADIAKAYSEHPKVNVVNESQKGVVFAANKGIELSKGRYIARMDADDIALPNRLRLQVDLLDNDPSLGVVSGKVQYLGPADNEGFVHYVDWLNSIVSVEDILLNQFVEFPIANPTMTFRKELFDLHEKYREGDFPEDYEFFLRLQAAGVNMKKVEETVLIWRDSESRLTRTDKRYSEDAFFRTKAKYLAKWLQKNNSYHPYTYIWGAGRLSRRRSDYLLNEGVEVVKYIDLKPSVNSLHYKDIPSPNEAFVVSYVANRGARDEIRSFLNQKGYTEGSNYILAS